MFEIIEQIIEIILFMDMKIRNTIDMRKTEKFVSAEKTATDDAKPTQCLLLMKGMFLCD